MDTRMLLLMPNSPNDDLCQAWGLMKACSSSRRSRNARETRHSSRRYRAFIKFLSTRGQALELVVRGRCDNIVFMTDESNGRLAWIVVMKRRGGHEKRETFSAAFNFGKLKLRPSAASKSAREEFGTNTGYFAGKPSEV